ncbi:hypothetical protein QUF70_11275 [Desulfobacterales bacterium HSG17]|nr:hypothetical protein [Desulfobacterales bacterium HSG17]
MRLKEANEKNPNYIRLKEKLQECELDLLKLKQTLQEKSENGNATVDGIDNRFEAFLHEKQSTGIHSDVNTQEQLEYSISDKKSQLKEIYEKTVEALTSDTLSQYGVALEVREFSQFYTFINRFFKLQNAYEFFTRANSRISEIIGSLPKNYRTAMDLMNRYTERIKEVDLLNDQMDIFKASDGEIVKKMSRNGYDLDFIQNAHSIILQVTKDLEAQIYPE